MKGKITYWLLSVVIFMKIFTTLDATGKIAVRLTSFKNENYFDFNGYCCESTRWMTSCTQSCDSAFKLCFDTALGFDTLSYCAYGSVGYIGNIPDRYITFRDHSLFSKPFKASFTTWPVST
ncbi:uncharacterized protein LOC112041577 [Lingula anatina]|uniref:Uncharacterized protein LOC112041577 n=1 Tax=Lingula anatina TaxID=7574 RepID=A0A2R2MKM4_LINAN|nr:uncharacterized protein LOC112041577 [Lingula anatina]|eukprot:XP_023930766.1 uncharacterized protein LOC112041577 [Lingula anatina]